MAITHRSVGDRRYRLQKREQQAEAAVERDPELLPVVCDSCGVLIGLAEVGQALRCVDCAVWVEPTDDLAQIAEVLTG